VNTLLLLGALALTAWLAGGHPPPRLGHGRAQTALLLGALGLLALSGASGAIAALGDTLYPAATLGEALAQDADAAAHALVRLRVAHPLIAAAAAALVLWLSWRWGVAAADPGRWARAAGALVLIQIAAGVVNVVLLAPVWLQLVHLLLADLTWIAVVLAGARRLAPQKLGSSADGP
jgi:heme A synthase